MTALTETKNVLKVGLPKGSTERCEEINAAITKSQEDVNKLVAAGKTGNLDQIKAATGAVGQSCKACHDASQKPRQ